MTPNERRLLSYCEVCAVEHDGRLDIVKLALDDAETLHQWNESGFVFSGRIVKEDCNQDGSMWCELTHDAFVMAHLMRFRRGMELVGRQPFKKAQ